MSDGPESEQEMARAAAPGGRMTTHADDMTLCAAIGAAGDERRAVLEHCAALRQDTVRPVRCPEVVVEGALPDPVALHGEDARVVMVTRNGAAHVWGAYYVTNYLDPRDIVRWVLEDDLARDPATATWHERTREVRLQWTPETMPADGQRVVLYYDDRDVKRVRVAAPETRQKWADQWNSTPTKILAWHADPLPEVSRG